MLLSARICKIILHVSKTSQPQQQLILNWMLLNNCFKCVNLLIWFDSNISQYILQLQLQLQLQLLNLTRMVLSAQTCKRSLYVIKKQTFYAHHQPRRSYWQQSMLSQTRVWICHNWTAFSKKGAFCQVALSSTVHFLFRSLPQLCFCLALTQSNMRCNIPAADELWMRLRFW